MAFGSGVSDSNCAEKRIAALTGTPLDWRILTALHPHMFFDDQKSRLQSPARAIPMIHIPFGIANKAG